MIFILTISAICLFVSIVFFVILKTISLGELAIMIAVQLAIAGAGFWISYGTSVSDQQSINSFVVDKKSERVSCEHSYKCNCYKTCSKNSNGTESCTEHCSTCYDHSYDVDWHVHTAIGTTIDIDRVDRQGVREPPRWSSVVIGEPTTELQSYTNYVKAAPDSLFRSSGSELSWLPAYPGSVYDYYRQDRLVTFPKQRAPGPTLDDAKSWNKSLSELNARIGAKSQVNAILVITRDTDRTFFNDLKRGWIGGKKNDVVLVVNVDAGMVPTWVDVMSWESNPIFNVKLRDRVMDMKVIERDALMDVFGRTIVELHKRKPMAEFEYLKASIVPSFLAWFLTFVVEIIAVSVMLYVFHFNDVGTFNNPYSTFRRGRMFR